MRSLGRITMVFACVVLMQALVPSSSTPRRRWLV